jgi:hypothetical protein
VIADYEKIRAENIDRYGWDTAVLDLIGRLYSDRTHFIYELIQNAEDATATELRFELFDDRLEVWHDGRPFTEADVRAICGVARSDKADDLTKIGKFGIGFKSVYAYTRNPHIYSGDEAFRIESYVRPVAVDPAPRPAPRPAGWPAGETATWFVFPFDLDTVAAEVAVTEIGAALAALAPATLLFLGNIARIQAGDTIIERTELANTELANTELANTELASTELASTELASPGRARRLTLSRGRRAEQWLVWHRQVTDLAGYRVEIAFRVDVATGQIIRCETSPLSVFLPTQKETFLGFEIQGPYRTTPARDNVGEQDPSNRTLATETAVLLTEVLGELRAEGMLTAEVLATLPLDATRFQPGSLLRPLFDAVREALARDSLIPVTTPADDSAIRYATAAEVKLAADPALPALLSPGQLFVTQDLAPQVRAYLRDEIGIEELTAADFLLRADSEFLEEQPDEWITRFYDFLYRTSGLWDLARTRPVIRLEDGSQVALSETAVYLPGSGASGFLTVRRAIVEDPAARRFLDVLNLTEPDVVDEVLELILPRYELLEQDPESLDLVRHAADLDIIMHALDEASASRRDLLLDWLRDSAFLIGENAATGEQLLLQPTGLYQRSRELELYFDGNPAAWFAADMYGPWLVQLRGMGVRDGVEVRARTPDPLGYVVIADEFASHERGLDGFDPDAEIDGLDFALRHPGHARSEYVWNHVLVPNRALVAGVVEKSVRESFADATRETVGSVIAAVAQDTAWLPAPSGELRRPADLSVEDLPETYTRDATLAEALGMAQPVIAHAARQLGIPAEILWALSTRPDLVAMIKTELAR